MPLGCREATARFGLLEGGSSRTAVERTGWRIVDPLPGAWLRDE
jgi:hypothetical protein